jgi:hypothetical protein
MARTFQKADAITLKDYAGQPAMPESSVLAASR